MDIITFVLIANVALLIGISKSAFAGALGVFAVPVLMLKLPPTEAITLMLPLLIVGDILSVHSYWKKWDHRLLISLIPGAIIGVSVAYLIIDFINAEHLQLMIGIICITFSLKNLFFKQVTLKALNNKASALIMSMFSGLTSSLVHAGGPPIIIYFSAIGLAPAKFIATASVFFFMMNIFKLIGVIALGMLTGEIILTAMTFIPLAFVGNWLGVKINMSLNKRLFLTIMNYLLLLLGCWLIMTK
jgi:uncharacterized membrane protein YfcA